jgi:hypothetical protein
MFMGGSSRAAHLILFERQGGASSSFFSVFIQVRNVFASHLLTIDSLPGIPYRFFIWI